MSIRAIFFSFALFQSSQSALALPEMARYGQFTCTSCHVSPAGGGTLTSYGRDFAAEKLSTWHFDGEEGPLEGLLPTSDRYLFGGDARWVKYDSTTDDTTAKKFWRMQTDLEVGVHFGPLWLTGMMGTKPAGPMDDPKDYSNLIHRGYAARVDLLDDHVILRAGLFLPKYGLMLADHTAYVRHANGLGPDSEQTQAEIIYQTDLFEITLANLIQSNMYDREGKSKSGFNCGVSTFLLGKHRINLHVLNTKLNLGTADTVTTSMGVSGVLTATKYLYGMFELDRVSATTKGESFSQSSEALIHYYTLNLDIYRGIVPYARYEFFDSDINKEDTSSTRWGAGISWYPRPHLALDARILRTIMNASKSISDETDVILHYYF